MLEKIKANVINEWNTTYLLLWGTQYTNQSTIYG